MGQCVGPQKVEQQPAPNTDEVETITINHIKEQQPIDNVINDSSPSSSSKSTENLKSCIQVSDSKYFQLDIPKQFENWFPPNNANKNVRSLFTFIDTIGEGVTSKIYHIEYQNKTCALKEIERNNKWANMLFITEARSLSKLKHCGIIHFIDMYFDEYFFYLLMDKADFNLFYAMKSNGYISEKKTKQITQKLLQTLAYMHSKNVVHRDLKPENVCFKQSDLSQPLIIDFGDCEIAKCDKSYNEFVGTPPYMSPERLREHKGWELKKSDIWAIGVIAYEMYSGQRCFDGQSQKEVFAKILDGNYEWPKNRRPSRKMREFVAKCLKYDTKERVSANEALDDEWFQNEEENE